MTTKTDTLAQKQRKQKIVLAIGGVALAGVLAFQLPKLLGNDGSSAATATPAPASAPESQSASQAPSTVLASATLSHSSARLAGVVIAPAASPRPGRGQLWSFSRFQPKDPFVQQVKETTNPAGGASSITATPAKASSPGQPSASPAPTGTPAAPPPAPFAYATLVVNGKLVQLQVKQLFPRAQQTFVLRAVTRRSIKIGVAGGTFTNAPSLELELGKRVTLVNTATGQRFVVKLVYVGSAPESVAGFSTPTRDRLTASVRQ